MFLKLSIKSIVEEIKHVVTENSEFDNRDKSMLVAFFRFVEFSMF